MREQKKTKSQEIEEFFNPFLSLAFAFLGKDPTQYMFEMAEDYQSKISFLLEKQKDDAKIAYIFSKTDPCIGDVFRYRMRRKRIDSANSTIKDFVNEFKSKPLSIPEYVIIGGYYKKYYAEAANSNEKKKQMIDIIDELEQKDNLDLHLWNMLNCCSIGIDYYLKNWNKERLEYAKTKVVHAQRIASIG